MVEKKNKKKRKITDPVKNVWYITIKPLNFKW